MLTKTHHVAIICSDYARSKAFYVDTLGFSVIREVWREDRGDWLTMLQSGEVVLELFTKPRTGPPSRRRWDCGIWPSGWRTQNRLRPGCGSGAWKRSRFGRTPSTVAG